MRFILKSAVLATATLLTFSPIAVLAQDNQASPDKKVIVRVDGVDITEQDVRLAEQELSAQISRMPDAQRRRILIEFLIENQLVARAAEAGAVGKSDGFQSRLAYWKRRALRDSYFESNIEADVSDAAAKAFYDKEVAKQTGGDEIRASHILVKTEEEAKAIFEALAHDGDFAELAKKHSIDPGSGANGGDLGFFGKGRMVPEFEKAAFALKDDEVSEPVKSQFGWHIIKRTEQRTQAPPPFAQIKDRIRLILIRRKATEIVDGFRKKAKIEYVDPAAKAASGAQ